MKESELIRHAAASRTVVDRVVEFFNPDAGLRRLRSRVMLTAATGSHGGYEGGRRARRGTKRWRPAEASPDADILPDLPDLRARSRDLARNVPIATGAIATKVTSVVGTGLQLQASIDRTALGIDDAQADAMEREQEREWCLFCASADFTGVQHLDELAVLAYRSTAESGDAFVVRRYREDKGEPYGTRLQLLEADRVSNPKRAADTDTISGGVEVNRDGVHVAYHVTDKHPGGLRTAGMNWERVPARAESGLRTVLHLFDRLRPDQTRGVPYLAPVIEHLKKLGDYSDAEVTAALVSAFYTVFVKSDADQSESPIAGETASGQGLEANEVKLGAGAVIGLNPGEDVSFANPTRPNAQFDPFTQAVLRQVGVALELPFELLIKHFTASYSASRAALEMAWQFFRKERAFMARRFYQPVYEWMMEEAVASGRLNRPGFFESALMRRAYLGANWIGPNRASIDPLKEAKADEVDLALGVKTREQICMERTGGEWERKHAQLVKEETARRAASLGAPPPQGGGSNDADDEDGDAGDDDTEDEGRQRGRR